MHGQSLRAAGEQEKINHGLFAHLEDDIFFFFPGISKARGAKLNWLQRDRVQLLQSPCSITCCGLSGVHPK